MRMHQQLNCPGACALEYQDVIAMLVRDLFKRDTITMIVIDFFGGSRRTKPQKGTLRVLEIVEFSLQDRCMIGASTAQFANKSLKLSKTPPKILWNQQKSVRDRETVLHLWLIVTVSWLKNCFEFIQKDKQGIRLEFNLNNDQIKSRNLKKLKSK